MSVGAVFFDRDGTLNEDVGYVSTPGELVVYPWAAEAVRLVNESGMKAIVVTNQSGVARGLLTEEVLHAIHRRLVEELASAGARIDAIYYCPHHPDFGEGPYRASCDCRKPKIGLVRRAAVEHELDLSRSWVIGDKASDMLLAAEAGAAGALVLTGFGAGTLAEPERWPCRPAIVAEDLLAAVRLVLERERPDD